MVHRSFTVLQPCPRLFHSDTLYWSPLPRTIGGLRPTHTYQYPRRSSVFYVSTRNSQFEKNSGIEPVYPLRNYVYHSATSRTPNYPGRVCYHYTGKLCFSNIIENIYMDQFTGRGIHISCYFISSFPFSSDI